MNRYVLEMPANIATPTMLANTAESIAAGSGGTISAKILEQAECEKMGMGLYLGVSACSAEPPKFIHLTYSPKGRGKYCRALTAVEDLHKQPH